jgi:glycosyltransferase involved in cell wall biosynthesis
VRALAIICARNEAIHIRRCIGGLIADGLDVVLVDHESNDATVALASTFLDRGLVSIETLPWLGFFSLSAQLAKKQQIIERTTHDWIVHVDADEWLCAPSPGQTLLAAIEEADAGGYNCINFHELVFVPRPGEDFATESYAARMTTYYFFEPTHPRLIRAWKRSAAFTNINNGGHLLEGREIKLSPRDLFLRHYMVLSFDHACRKYLSRVFSPEELAKGMHKKRAMLDEKSLVLKNGVYLRDLPSPESVDFDLNQPAPEHYWLWCGDPAR